MEESSKFLLIPALVTLIFLVNGCTGRVTSGLSQGRSKKKNLTKKYRTLKKDYESLYKKYERLKRGYNSLKDNFSKYEEKHENLKEKLTELRKNCSGLKERREEEVNRTGKRKGCFDCTKLRKLKADAPGNDMSNPNGEYVIFKNVCSFSCNLTNWEIEDEANNVYNFPSFTLNPKENVTLYSGYGDDTSQELHWCTSNGCSAIWNNGGDTLYLYNRSGSLVLSHSY